VKALAWRSVDGQVSVWPDSRTLAPAGLGLEGFGCRRSASSVGARFGRGSSPRFPQMGIAPHRNGRTKIISPAVQERGCPFSLKQCPCRSPLKLTHHSFDTFCDCFVLRAIADTSDGLGTPPLVQRWIIEQNRWRTYSPQHHFGPTSKQAS